MDFLSPGGNRYRFGGYEEIDLEAAMRLMNEMHNLDDAALFRPSSWHRFGAGSDPIGADYRACAAYGPLY